MSDFLIMCIGAAIAVVLAKRFVDAVKKEMSAHDDSSIKGGNDNR